MWEKWMFFISAFYFQLQSAGKSMALSAVISAGKCAANGMANSTGNSMGNGTKPNYVPHLLPKYCHTFPGLKTPPLPHL